jgi:site-specific recombinase XerD
MGLSNKLFEQDGDWISYRTVQHLYSKVFKQLGFSKSGTHVLRHTFAVSFLEEVKDIYALQKILGHSDLKVTQIYAKYTVAAVRRAFGVFASKRGSRLTDGSRPLARLVSDLDVIV